MFGSLETQPAVCADQAANETRALLRAAMAETLESGSMPSRLLRYPLPFSRASGSDYLDLVRLWNQDAVRRIEKLPSRPCPACGESNHRSLFRSYDQYPFHACNECGTWFVPRLVEETTFEEFFTEVPEARTIADRMMAGRNEGTRDSDRQRIGFYFDILGPHLRAVSGRSPRYLDIGCGVGHSIDLAVEHGMDAAGIEINEVALEVARSHGRNVHHPDQWGGSDQFDLVSLFETLEHLTTPDDIVARAVERLSSHGMLIITVPNRASWEVSVLRERCFHVFGGFEGVGHINLFDRDGLSTLLARHGMSLVYSDGQFSNNVLEVCDGLLNSNRTALDVFGRGELSVSLPEATFDYFNSIGPALATFDRMNCRSPILIGIACRTSALPDLAPVVEAMEERRRNELAVSLAAA